MGAANKSVTTSGERPSESTELVKRRNVWRDSLYFWWRRTTLKTTIGRKLRRDWNRFWCLPFPSLTGEFLSLSLFPLGILWVHAAWLYFWWLASWNLDRNCRCSTIHNICICFSRMGGGGSERKQALKPKSQSKMEWHLSSVFDAGRPLHCDVDKHHPSSTTGD